ncbi:hypothetical protein [Fodinicola feengrottensis]|uniref:hypothetical protein n=1 Tax=Fodinicola feengrottensis TaxID=435914 RepID=UPI0031E48CC8
MSQNDEDFWKIVEPLGSKRKQRRAARKLRTGRKKPRTSRIAVVVAVVAVLAGAGLAVSWVTDTITAAHATTPAAAAIPKVTPAANRVFGPFEGTPAEKFAEGANAIVLPKGVKTGAWSADEVSHDLGTVKSALIASHLDHRVLVSGDFAGFLALLAPDSRAESKKRLAEAKQALVVRVDAGATLAKDQPRLSGVTTVKATKDDDGRPILQITTNYVWAYPFQGQSIRPGERVVVVHDEIRWGFYQAEKVTRSSAGMWVNRSEDYKYNIDCGAANKGFIKPYTPMADPGPNPGTDLGDSAYDPTRSLDIRGGC